MPLALLTTQHDPIALGAERMRRSLSLFCRRAWAQIDPNPLTWNWHMEAVCVCLEAVTRDRISDLLINIPPGHAKSMLVSVLWPAWEWAVDPRKKLLTSSYKDTLVARDAVRFRDLIVSPWYQEHFVKGAWKFKDDQNLKMLMKNTLGGERIGVTTGSGTGLRAHTQIVDDPLTAESALSAVEREAVNRWFFETMSSRFVTPDNPKRVIIMQRLHEGDLAGEVIARGGFQQLILPTRFDVKRRAIVKDKKGAVVVQDPRTVEGELLFPERFSKATVDQSEGPTGMGAQAFHAQHQQKPTPPEGNLIKREWFRRRWRLEGDADLTGFETRVLPRPDSIEIFTDAAFKATAKSDRVAIGVVGLKYPDIYLLDLVWDRMTFTETLNAIRDLRRKWTRVSAVVIEDKANGSAIIDTLRKEIAGVIGVEPEGGKESRVIAASRFIEAGNVWLPQTALDNAGALIEEACAFPRASHDDGIDMLAYAVNRLLADSSASFLMRLTQST